MNGLTAVQRKATIAHEFGHAMGLSHSPLPPNAYEKVTVGAGTNLELSNDGRSVTRKNPQTGSREKISLDTIKNKFN